MTELPRESDDSNKSTDATESVTSQDTQNSVDPVEDVSDIKPEQPTPTYNRDASKTDKSARMKKRITCTIHTDCPWYDCVRLIQK
ncbi:hypothetical protein JCM18901_274 [Psychrobacter sp. JCM 18901]|uniref:hypothetical protein n=1 Tax=Psychrobacter sp. JCM 18901 TaxID=1298609 RepID=UPI000435B654|nr:hypothetical protein [Psychrobacter sp. JCM 18901]GAF54687.1 hypothetical protein JCM18901_274 [Psychrobacter sp. JCM 18901]